jgi:uncharacterized protein
VRLDIVSLIFVIHSYDQSVAKAIYDNWPDKYEGLIAKGTAAAEQFATTGATAYVPACSDTDPNAAMFVPNGVFPYYIDPALGAIPQYDNRFAVMSWPKWLQFEGVKAAAGIQQPTLMVHSTSAALPDGAKQFFSNLKGEKHIEWLNNYNQMQFYYQPEAVNAAVEQVVEWLSVGVE